MNSLVLRVAIATASSFCGPAAAQTNWSWSFDQDVINVAIQNRIYVTIANDAASQNSIRTSGISVQSFGNMGILSEPGFVGPITPSIGGLPLDLAPGDVGRTLAIEFSLRFDNLPTPGITYIIRPTYTAFIGENCGGLPFPPQCAPSSQFALRPLTVTYAPVPEVATIAQLLLGCVVLTGVLVLRGRTA